MTTTALLLMRAQCALVKSSALYRELGAIWGAAHETEEPCPPPTKCTEDTTARSSSLTFTQSAIQEGTVPKVSIKP
jgi:hypothetical protein